MNKVIRILLLITFLAMIPFLLLFMKEMVYANTETEEVSGCVPYDLSIEKDRFAVTVGWKTMEKCAGSIEYDLTANSSGGTKVRGSEGILPVNNHVVEVKDLKPGVKYYLWVFSNGEPFGEGGKPVEVEL